MLGYGLMGKAHSLSYRIVNMVADPPCPEPLLISISGRNPDQLERARQKYGWQYAESDWRAQVADPRIMLYDNVGPNDLHVEPTIEAVHNGKHVLCEKPLAPDGDTAFDMWRAAEEAKVIHMCGFNYRFLPALQLARDLIRGNELGTIHHFRAHLLVSHALDKTRPRGWRQDRLHVGTGALGILGSHHIDLARFLVGEIESVAGFMRTFVPELGGQPVDLDDAFAAIVHFDNGAYGIFEATQVAGGHLVTSRVEVDGSRGSLAFDIAHLNELRIADHSKSFRTIHVTQREHPYSKFWWPAGHPLGWADSFVHQAYHLLNAITGRGTVAPLGATFEDGYRCAEISDAVVRASCSGAAESVTYRTLPEVE